MRPLRPVRGCDSSRSVLLLPCRHGYGAEFSAIRSSQDFLGVCAQRDWDGEGLVGCERQRRSNTRCVWRQASAVLGGQCLKHGERGPGARKGAGAQAGRRRARARRKPGRTRYRDSHALRSGGISGILDGSIMRLLLPIFLFLAPFAAAQQCQRASDCPEHPSGHTCQVPRCVNGQCTFRLHQCEDNNPCTTERTDLCQRLGLDQQGEWIAKCLSTPFTCPPALSPCQTNACVSQNNKPVCQTQTIGCLVNGVLQQCQLVNGQPSLQSGQCDNRRSFTKSSAARRWRRA